MRPVAPESRHSFLMQENFATDFLYFGLPCIWDETKKKYLLFSPYCLKIAHVDSDIINLDNTRKKLAQLEFFGFPAKPSKSNKTVKIGLILTTDCNLRCKYCFVVPQARVRYIKPEYAISIIKEKITPEVEEIYLTFFGGEPTLNMETLKTTVDYVENIGFKAHFLINTNGTLSNHGLDYLIEKNFTFVVSSDGVPRINDEQRPMLKGGKVSEEIERTIKRLVEANALFKVRATLTDKSIFYLKESIGYWDSLGVKFAHFEPVATSNKEIEYPSPKIYVEQVMGALDEAEKVEIWVISSPYMNLLTPSTYFCTTAAGEDELYTPDGSISLCYRVQEYDHPFQDFIVGKYDAETDSFSRYSDRIDLLKEIDVSAKSHCDNCAAKYICGGGCPLRNKIEAGSYMGIDRWMCYVKKALVHDAIIRIDRALDKGQVPVIFGESIFENLSRKKFIKKRGGEKNV